ncbi:MAG: 30S ribosomal protein S12 methylthiotransferase RimO [Armatimonadaceae bacterium]
MSRTPTTKSGEKTRIGLVNLGCPKNLVDAEEMLGALAETGEADIVATREDADVLVVNTCAFIESAKEESIGAILDAVRRKEAGQVRRVVVTGCLAQRYASELTDEIPEVDAYLGIQAAAQITNAVFGTRSRSLPMAGGAGDLPARNLVAQIEEKYPLIPHTRLRATEPWTAYLKISEGCDHTCTFCSIPKFRGKHRSKPLERILDEARYLVENGATELNLIAQDTTAYGIDLYRELALPRLLEGLGKVAGLRWVRLLYCYPTMMSDRLIRTMADTENVARYVDIPLQHGDDGMLRRMKRGGSVASYHRLLERLREAMPDIAIRTTFLVGFPGEDAAAFANLQRFIETERFDRLGVFEYSREDGTPGYTMRPVVPERIAATRRKKLMAIQQEISHQRNREWVGRPMDILVERRENDVVIGRSFRDAPEIDGTVRIAGCDARPGDWVRVRVTDAEPYDVLAEPCQNA